MVAESKRPPRDMVEAALRSPLQFGCASRLRASSSHHATLFAAPVQLPATRLPARRLRLCLPSDASGGAAPISSTRPSCLCATAAASRRRMHASSSGPMAGRAPWTCALALAPSHARALALALAPSPSRPRPCPRMHMHAPPSHSPSRPLAHTLSPSRSRPLALALSPSPLRPRMHMRLAAASHSAHGQQLCACLYTVYSTDGLTTEVAFLTVWYEYRVHVAVSNSNFLN